MYIKLFIFSLALLSPSLAFEAKDAEKNLTAPKDMYVVRATVYQVGILTNRTNETEKIHNGRQETITFYRNNGSNIDLGAIPDPLVTNVTAENVVGVAPVSPPALPWRAMNPPTGMNHGQDAAEYPMEVHTSNGKTRRDVSAAPAKITKGSAVIPSAAGVQSIALPPLLTLNKNMSDIPVPIPNVSVVSYAKVNTLVHSP